MKDKLIAAIAEKAGLSTEQATSAADAALGFLKENPTEIQGLVGIEGTGFVGDMKEKLGDVGEKLGPAKEKLGDVGEKVGERLGGLFGRKKE